MDFGQVLRATAREQARGIREGRWTAAELVTAQRAAIARVNPELNAYVAQTSDLPRAPLDASSLSGIGFAVKDNIALAGFPSRAGLRAWDAPVPGEDAPVVRRLKAAGLLCLGRLNMSPMALGATNANRDFGNCHNPQRRGWTPGGSSGGAGAAVAAGLCAVALGTDTMGSVRIPAAYCGVVGFKPGAGEISTEGVVPLCRLLDQVGILARSVDDVAQAFALARTPGATSAGSSESPAEMAIPARPRSLGLSDGVADAFEAVVATLRSGGWRLREVDLSFHDFGGVRRAGLLLCEAELLDLLAPALTSRADELPPDLVAMLRYAGRKSAVDLARALSIVVDAAARMAELQREHELLLLPTAPQAAFRFDEAVPANQADLTAIANMTGAPGISVPLPVVAGAMPIGVQIVGVRGGDARVLAQAALLEAQLATSGPSLQKATR
jgi:Asp-tRNA(Asn)/Glu-tRNA(Gln) amidotransferase A subunit family amidase